MGGSEQAESYREAVSFNARLVAAFRRDLARYEYNNKGTIRFPLSEPVPETLIGAIARFRAKEVIDERKAAAAKRSETR